MTLYDLKPRFQELLRPSVRWLAQAGISANQVTLCAAVVSVVLGVVVAVSADTPGLFVLIPGWLLLRMALTALEVGADTVTLVPIGINYESKERTRTAAWIRVGEPIDVAEWLQQHDGDERHIGAGAHIPERPAGRQRGAFDRHRFHRPHRAPA